MTNHLGYEPHAPEGRGSGNSRNGTMGKTVHRPGELTAGHPPSPEWLIAPTLVKKRQRRLEGFDDKVVALYAHGLTTREIQGHLEELYGVEISPTLTSTITDAVLEDVRIWQSRPFGVSHPLFRLLVC